MLTTPERSTAKAVPSGSRELLAGRKYAIDYFQREYKWEKKQVSELLEDLVDNRI
jgi:uncharacterized protein with ParB-like and HNH nuclease domain